VGRHLYLHVQELALTDERHMICRCVMSIRRRVRACTRLSGPAKALTTRDYRYRYVRGISGPSTLLNNKPSTTTINDPSQPPMPWSNATASPASPPPSRTWPGGIATPMSPTAQTRTPPSHTFSRATLWFVSSGPLDFHARSLTLT
jgi:hypothetical protein